MSKTFEATGDWQEFTINFDEFEKNGYMMSSMKPKNIRELSIAGFGRDFDVDLEFKDVQIF
jgi:hypothetical protein